MSGIGFLDLITQGASDFLNRVKAKGPLEENMLFQMGSGLLSNGGHISGIGLGAQAAAKARAFNRQQGIENRRADRVADMRQSELDLATNREDRLATSSDRNYELQRDQLDLSRDRLDMQDRQFNERLAIDRQNAASLRAYRERGVATSDIDPRGNMVLPDGSVTTARFNKATGTYEINTAEGWVPAPPGASEISDRNAGMGMSTYARRFDDLNLQETGIRNLVRYASSVGNTREGFGRLSDEIVGGLKTLVGSARSDSELAAAVSNSLQQGLLGNIRVETIGGGVMTEQDALRLIDRLGGRQGGLKAALTDKTVVMSALKDILEDKVRNYNREYDLLEKTRWGTGSPRVEVDMDTLFRDFSGDTAPLQDRMTTHEKQSLGELELTPDDRSLLEKYLN